MTERAPAKLNLALQVGPPGEGGLHELCSLFASIDLADELQVEPAHADEVVCPGVEGENLAARALAALRAAAPDAGVPAVRVAIRKRIPVAAGLGGGSADAAAVLRAASELADEPPGQDVLVKVAAELGSDVPSQLAPGHAIVSGTGERVESVRLPAMAFVLVPSHDGLSTAAVYAELDRIRHEGVAPLRAVLDPGPLRRLARCGVAELAAGMENDLEAPALRLRPELAATLDALRDAGALGARVTGSGPTAFGVFAGRAEAEAAAARLPRSIVAEPLS